MIELTVPCKTESPNVTRRMHYRQIMRIKDEWTWYLKIAKSEVDQKIFDNSIPFKNVHFILHRKRFLDTDNKWGSVKDALDCIKNLKWITDDKEKDIHLEVEQVKSKTDFTVIKLS